MPIGTAIALAAGLGAAGSIGGAALASSAAGNAADTQANAAVQAAQIQANEADKALQFQEGQYATGQNELAPWLQSGDTALAQLMYGLGMPVSGNATLPGAGPAAATTAVPRGNSFEGGRVFNDGGGRNSMLRMGGTYQLPARTGVGSTAPASLNGTIPTHTVPMASLINPKLGTSGYLNFVPPNAITEQNDPGYKARLALGEDAVQRSAAAAGGVLSGGTARAMDQFAQDYASNEYSNVYNRALTNNMTAYNRLASLAGLGQQTGTNMVGAGNQSANSIANTLMELGSMQGQAYNNAAAARGSGYVGSANAWSGALGNLGSYAMLLPMMQLMNQNGGAGVPTGYGDGVAVG